MNKKEKYIGTGQRRAKQLRISNYELRSSSTRFSSSPPLWGGFRWGLLSFPRISTSLDDRFKLGAVTKLKLLDFGTGEGVCSTQFINGIVEHTPSFVFQY